ncbi:MAG: isoprenylcysteine carboxylmethyltransferase family protein [Candidatus Acidiferrales bacterium]
MAATIPCVLDGSGARIVTMDGILRFSTAKEVISAIINGAWAVFVIYWIVAARTQSKAQKREPALERLLHVLWLAGAFFLLYKDDLPIGPLNRQFLPHRLWIASLGAGLTVAGVGFAIWARRHLGKNWSAEVTIREEHNLIRTGPYKHIRHPIYTGLLLAIAGTAIAVGEYRALVAFAIFLIGWTRKARKEESFLALEFGSTFEEHKRHTGFFLPRFS